MQFWKVILDGKVIDTVQFSNSMSKTEVKKSLVNHDGYEDSIEVRKA